MKLPKELQSKLDAAKAYPGAAAAADKVNEALGDSGAFILGYLVSAALKGGATASDLTILIESLETMRNA